MARKPEQGLRYFPLQTDLDNKFKMIEALHGISGFGVVIKLFQKIYANNYYINVDKMFIIVLSNEINVDINSINAIIKDSLEWGLFDQSMFDNYSILTSTGIQKQYFEIVHRRKRVEIIEDFLLIPVPEVINKAIKTRINSINVSINPINVSISTQRETKEKEKEKVKKNTIKDSASSGGKTKTHPPDNWLLSEATKKCLFKDIGITKEYAQHKIDTLRDWSIGNNEKRSDWDAVLRNAIRNDHQMCKIPSNCYKTNKATQKVEVKYDITKNPNYDPRFPDRLLPKSASEKDKLAILAREKKYAN